MPGPWRPSPAWFLVALIVGMFAVGLAVPLEISSYSTTHHAPPADESLQTAFRIFYSTQWSGFGHHWYNYTVTFGAPGLVWGDLWMTVYLNGTTTPIGSVLAHSVVNNATVGYFSFWSGAWTRGGSAPVLLGEILSIDSAEYEGDGDTLYITAIQGSYFGSLSQVIP